MIHGELVRVQQGQEQIVQAVDRIMCRAAKLRPVLRVSGHR